MSVIDYSRCGLCPSKNTCVPPNGPTNKGGILFLGEAPGHFENKRGIPFVGKTGEEVDRHYLPLAGLRRQHVTFDNAISCLPDTPGGKLDPTKEKHIQLLECCAEHHLYPLIKEMQPKLIVPMGAFACRAIFGRAFELDLRHGIPTTSPWGQTFPMHHPASGMHEPKKMLQIRTDWDKLRKFMRGTLLVPTDIYDGFEDYAEVTDADEIWSLDPTLTLAADTESSPSEGPYCLTYSQYAGTGRLIRASRKDLLRALSGRLHDWRSEILFHNWLYDWSVVEDMGLELPLSRVVDTMAIAYHLGNLPQGLKALALRELGMSMMDFDDVVTPHSRERVLEYYELASFEEWPKPEAEMVIEDGKWKLYQPQSMSTKLKRFHTDYRKNPELDVFRRWENWEDHHLDIEAKMGPWPGKDIRHVPFEQALFYACRDSDALGRLWPILKRMRTFVRRYSQESWRERAGIAITV